MGLNKEQFEGDPPVFIIRLANRSVESQPAPPERCARCASQGFHRWGSPRTRWIVDISVSEIQTQRYRCKNCSMTVTARPKGIRRATRQPDHGCEIYPHYVGWPVARPQRLPGNLWHLLKYLSETRSQQDRDQSVPLQLGSTESSSEPAVLASADLLYHFSLI